MTGAPWAGVAADLGLPTRVATQTALATIWSTLNFRYVKFVAPDEAAAAGA